MTEKLHSETIFCARERAGQFEFLSSKAIAKVGRKIVLIEGKTWIFRWHTLNFKEDCRKFEIEGLNDKSIQD